MPEVIKRRTLNKICPSNCGKLVEITQKWDPFPEDCDGPYKLIYQICKKCGYEIVVQDELFHPEQVPYVKTPATNLCAA